MKIQISILKLLTLIICFSTSAQFLQAQNIGIGVTNPIEKLDVLGRIRSTGIVLTSGGNQYDFLVKSSSGGNVGFRKGHGGIGLNYIICMQGEFPSQNPPAVTGPFLGEVKLFAGNFPPLHWAFCHGQLYSIAQNTALFAILGNTYGGDGLSTFAVPDLRGAAAIGFGQQVPSGYTWTMGEKVN